MAAEQKHWLRRYRSAVIVGLVAVLFIVASNWSFPYVLYGPGSAEPVHPRVETGHELEEKGALLFTTVSTYSKPNVFSILYAWINPRMDIVTEEKATGGTVNYAAYRNLLAYMRDSSENGALMAAYDSLGRQIQIEEQGVIVRAFLPDTQAREHGLQEGDIITSADGKETLTAESLTAVLQSKKAGETVKLAGTRGDKPFEAEVPLIAMASTGKPGVGFYQETVLKVTAPDPVKFDFADTGGPSAGLMMTLEIVAQLTGDDLSRGYRVAGTGTIAADGTVGQIGGIKYKLMAADREKADYFLVPYDEKNGASNWKEAEETVKELDLDLELVKVSTLDDALAFLRDWSRKRKTVAIRLGNVVFRPLSRYEKPGTARRSFPTFRQSPVF
ncbi:PDZ domain-containing protein [Cohnella algarum]|uniref:YlbL family protein n=1 Tax=Cohnella algarum TaxID=2044859 RepID=UPI00196790E8|nr:PDZ domain-containing protein [Cohnella algarum]MBN2982075.1 PDZ domain-containing protein [Cohnella algarum]